MKITISREKWGGLHVAFNVPTRDDDEFEEAWEPIGNLLLDIEDSIDNGVDPQDLTDRLLRAVGDRCLEDMGFRPPPERGLGA